MYKLKTKASFDSAHFLSGYNGKCKNIHGHRWIVEIEVGNESLASDKQNRGMVVDFSDLKSDLKAMVQEFDHSFIIEKGSLREQTLELLHEEGFRIIELPFRPTAENFSRYFFEKMKKNDYKVIAVNVYETPNNMASYTEE